MKNSNTARIDFQHLGIGELLKRGVYEVPINQREYAWRIEEVENFFDDIQNAMNKNLPTYFLGTILLTAGKHDIPEIADGQQRLATTTMLLAAIRD